MKKVVIIGAGPAGLSTAYHLLINSNDYEIIIIEQNEFVGGISKTIDYNGNKMDLGGHRFFTKNKEVMKLWETMLSPQNNPSLDEIILNVRNEYSDNGKNPEKEDNVFLKRRRISRIFYKNKFFDYPVTLSIKTIKKLGIKDTIISGISYLKSCIKKLDEFNLENFYINRFGRKLYEIFFQDYTEKLWGIHPIKIDSSWGSQRVKGISIKTILIDFIKKVFRIKNNKKEVSLIESFYYPKYGPGQMYEVMTKKIKEMGGKIFLNSKVIKINKNNDIIESIVYYNGNKTIKIDKIDYLISSMPIKDLVNAMNNVPNNIRKIAVKLPYRDFITIGIIIDKLNIKNNTKIKTINNIIPDTWIYVQDKNVKLGRIQVFNNWSPYLLTDINKVSLGLEYFCQENDDFWNLSNKELFEYAKNELIKMGFIDNNVILYDYHVEKVKKAYPAYFGSYNKFPYLKKYLNDINNLFCIGRNGMHRYNNMDHSIESGIVCANNIISNISEKDNIWNVNTNDSYHEEKK